MLEITGIVDAAGVKASVERAVESGLGEKTADFSKKFVAIATDGAAVMTGCKAGVVALMKVTQPSLVGIHCFSHRLELACRDFGDEHIKTLVDQFRGILAGAGVDVDSIPPDWTMLKTLCYRR